jgi:hypothetical protein
MKTLYFSILRKFGGNEVDAQFILNPVGYMKFVLEYVCKLLVSKVFIILL